MKTFFRISLLLLAGCSAGSAQTVRFWQELNGVAGFFRVEEGNANRLYGIRGDASVYTSSDRGTSWQPSTFLGGQIIELFARGRNAILARIDDQAANAYQFHLSTDNGETWTRITTSNTTTRRLIGLTDSGAAYAYFRDTFFGQPVGPYYLLKYDGAGGWPFAGVPLPGIVSNGLNIISASLIDHHGVILFGSNKVGLFLTRDGGQTWEQSFSGRGISALALTSDNRIYLAADPTVSDGGVYVSSDGAQNWTYLGFSDKTVNALAADTAGALLASTADGVYRYTGNPDAWEFSGPFSGPFDVMRAAGKDTILASSASWGLFRSPDGGTSWIQSGPRQRDVSSMVETSSGTTLAGTLGARVFRSSDDGTNWVQSPDGSICDNIYALAERGGLVYAGTECGVYRSTDEGATWDHPAEGIESGPIAGLAFLPSGEIFAGTLFGVIESTDNGATWTTSGLSTSGIVALCAGPLGQLYAVTDQAGVYESDDAGATWLARGLVRNDLLSVHADAAGTLFVGAYGGVWRSSDGGASWTQFRFTSGYVPSVTSLGLQAVYAATPQGIFVSGDDGESWTALSQSGLLDPHVLSLAFDSRGVLFAGTYNGGVFRTVQTLLGVEETAALPAAFHLAQNYPNPFNPATVIEFSVPAGEKGTVMLRVFDLLGRQVASLVNETKPPGLYRLSWDASALPAGVYFYRLQAGTHSETKKMLLVR